MTVTSTNQKVTFNGNGSTTVFAYNFKIFADADLLVVLRVTATGAETTQTLTTNYTVSGAGETSGGNVTMGTAPASGTTLTVLRAQPNLQGLDLVPNDPFPAGNLEDSLDKLTFMVQANEEEISRAVRFTSANTITSPEFATTVAERANKLFSFDASGNLQITQEIGVARGNWAASTAYDNRDIINDTSNQDVYIVNTAHTSSGSLPISTNANASKYTLLIDASQINKVVSDTSPQLGGELQSNSHDIKMADGDKVIFGTNSDATIEYDEAATDKLKIVASSVSLSGNISALSFDPTNDVSSGDNASLGYTSAEGAILIGQGTTNDITLKNDTDTAVLEIPTGTTNVTIAGNLATGGTITATTSISIGSAVLAEAELEMLDGITAGTVAASKAVVVDGNKDASSFRNLTASGAITGGSLVIGSADISEAELEMIDGITAGTAAASKAMVLDGSADITGGRNLTISGELDAATLDISGDIDVAGNSVLASADITGVATAATFEPDGDTAAGDNAAIGYTSAEGLILTGQGSTGDVTIKNDADAVVLQVPTGTTNVNIIGNLDVDGTLTMGSTATLNSSGVLQTAAQTNITSLGTLTALAVDNITLDGNTISTTDSNGNLLLTPNGAGDIIAETDKFYIRNTNDGQLGPYLILDHVTTSPGSVDFNGVIFVNTTDAGGNQFQPFTLAVVSTDVTSGAATGKALFTVKEDGATPYYLTLDGDAEKVILGKSTDITGSLDVSADAVIDGTLGVAGVSTFTDDVNIAKTGAGDDTTLKVASSASTGDNDATVIVGNGGTGDSMLRFDYESSTDRARIGVIASDQVLRFYTGGDNERFKLTSAGAFVTGALDVSTNAVIDGNVGIGVSSPAAKVDIRPANEAANTFRVYRGISGGYELDYLNISQYAGDSVFNSFSNNAANSEFIFQQNGTEALRIDASGNVGIGQAPETWTTYSPVLQIGNAAAIATYLTDDVNFTSNAYYNSTSPSGWKFQSTDTATRYQSATGSHTWYNSASGDADAALTWVKQLEIDASGNIIIANTGGTLYTTTAGSGNFRAGVNAGNSIAAVGGTAAGTNNVLVGDEAGTALNTGASNVLVGYNSGVTMSTGGDNVGVGMGSMKLTTLGSRNVAVGENSLYTNVAGNRSTAVGFQALFAQNPGTSSTPMLNTAVGYDAGKAILDSVNNTMLGANSGILTTTGHSNTFIGQDAGGSNVSGDSNIVIGNGIDAASATADSQLNIGGWITGLAGLIGIGTNDPQTGLHVQGADGSVNGTIRITSTSVASAGMACDAAGLNFGADTGGFVFKTGATANDPTDTGTTALKIDASGIVTKPLQPAFQAHKNGTDQSNFAVGSDVTVTWTHEAFDQNADFDLGNNRFVAPVTGKYQLNLMMRLENIDSASDYYVVRITTTLETYDHIVDPDYGQDNAFYPVQISVLANMDAGDTATIIVNQQSGTAQTDIDGNREYTNFSGYLVA